MSEHKMSELSILTCLFVDGITENSKISVHSNTALIQLVTKQKQIEDDGIKENL